MRPVAIAIEGDWELRNSCTTPGSLKEQFTVELEAGASQLQVREERTLESLQATVDIVDGCAEQSLPKPGEHGVPPAPMKKRHCTRHEPAAPGRKSAALNEVIALAQLINEARDLQEIVAAVGITQ